MKLKIKFLGIDSGGKPIVTLNKNDADELGIKFFSRVSITIENKKVTAIVHVVTKSVLPGIIGFYDDIKNILNVPEYSSVEVDVADFPSSLHFIRKKLKKRKLNYTEIYEIVKDVVAGNLSEIEITSYVTALHEQGMDIDEITSMTIAMVNTGKKLELNKKIVIDKHSIGGVPGDKTSLLIVPILAAAGFTIPKTSSRAITSAGGTADKAEVLMPVEFNIQEMKRIVEKTGGCFVWGGALQLAPADDIFIQVEYPLLIDPIMLPSIMSKKKATGITNLLIDIPTGRGTKIKTIEEAKLLAKDFIEIGNRIGIKTQCALTYGEQPIGHTIGPALEAKEALEILMNKNNVSEQIEKVLDLSGILFEMVGKENGRAIATEILQTGKAEKKMREIIHQQGGNSEITPDQIKIGEYQLDIKSEESGTVLWIDNNALVEVARAAGAPKDKESGIFMHKKLNDKIKKNDIIFTVYIKKQKKIQAVKNYLNDNKIYGIADRREMLIDRIKETPYYKKAFIT